MAIHDGLLAHFGPRGWWPGESPFEVMVGAVLTQHTSWKNVERAISNLKALGLTSPEAIMKAGEPGLLGALKPSGYYNLKAKRLRALCAMALSHGKGGLRPKVLELPLEELRGALLAVKGVGPETADSIALYAAGHPSFVVDAYTRRLLLRHGLMEGDPPYEDIRAWFMEKLPNDAALFNEFHALIVAVGHHFCGPMAPQCGLCPLGSDPHLILS
jgi:endonuclease-3 related protein